MHYVYALYNFIKFILYDRHACLSMNKITARDPDNITLDHGAGRVIASRLWSAMKLYNHDLTSTAAKRNPETAVEVRTWIGDYIWIFWNMLLPVNALISMLIQLITVNQSLWRAKY